MAWLLRTPSSHTKKAYRQDLDQFLTHAGIAADAWEQLAQVHPEHVAAWREQLAACGMTNAAIRRKLRRCGHCSATSRPTGTIGVGSVFNKNRTDTNYLLFFAAFR